MKLIALIALAASVMSAQTKSAAKAPAPPAKVVWTQEPTGFMGVDFNSTKTQADIKLGPIGLTKCIPGIVGIAVEYCNVPDIQLGNAAVSVIFEFHDRKFVRAMGSFASKDFAAFRDVLIERYGMPTSSRTETVKNGAGSTFENVIVDWSGDSILAELSRFSGKITEGAFTIEPKWLLEEDKKAGEEAKKKAAKSF